MLVWPEPTPRARRMLLERTVTRVDIVAGNILLVIRNFAKKKKKVCEAFGRKREGNQLYVANQPINGGMPALVILVNTSVN